METNKKGALSPKEKALKLYDIYMDEMIEKEAYFVESAAKQCALIAVENEYNAKIKAYNELYEFCPDVVSQAVFYAQKELKEVKAEIEKI